MEQGTRQECVLAPLLSFFAAVMLVIERHFLADASIMDNMVQLQQKRRRGE